MLVDRQRWSWNACPAPRLGPKLPRTIVRTWMPARDGDYCSRIRTIPLSCAPGSEAGQVERYIDCELFASPPSPAWPSTSRQARAWHDDSASSMRLRWKPSVAYDTVMTWRCRPGQHTQTMYSKSGSLCDLQRTSLESRVQSPGQSTRKPSTYIRSSRDWLGGVLLSR